MGTPAFAVPSLKALHAAKHEVAFVVTNPDRPQGRSREPVAPPVKEAARELGLEVYQPEKVKGDARLEVLKSAGVDLAVVVAFGQILPKAIRESPGLGYMINLHASLLPRHRGAAPVAGALLAGDTKSGDSVQKIEKELDAGPLLASRELAIDPQDTRGSLETKLATLGAGLLVECVAKIERGEAVFVPQDASKATHQGKIETPQAAIDWKKTPEEIERLVRAMVPDPIAWFDSRWGKLQVLKAKIALRPPRAVQFLLPGQAADTVGEDLIVATGDDGFLALSTVRLAGKSEMSGAAF